MAETVSFSATVCITLGGSSLVTAPPFGTCVRKNSASSAELEGTLTSYLPGLLGRPERALRRSGTGTGAPASGPSAFEDALDASDARGAGGSSAASRPAAGVPVREVHAAKTRRTVAVRDDRINAADRIRVRGNGRKTR
jgi:hypothetical protein